MLLKNIPRLKVSAIRSFSAVADIKEYVDPELETAKPFNAIPRQSLISMDILPGGKLYGKPMDEWHVHFQEKHGKIIHIPGIMGRPPMVVTYDPEDMKKVYRFDGQWPFRMGLDTWTYWRQNKELFKNFQGLVLQQGEPWKKYRTILNPVMMQPKTVSLYVPEIDTVARDFIEVTRKSLDGKKETPADYGLYIQRFTMEAIGTIAFETRLNVLEPKEGNKGTELAKLVDEMFELTFDLDMNVSIWKYYKTKKFYRFLQVMDKSAEIIREYIDEAIERLEREGSKKPEELHSVLYKLLKIDKEVAIIMGMDMMQVGIDTTGSSIKNLLYLLASNPEKQAKLREEVMTVLPQKTDKLTAENMKNMPYLRAAMKEAQRLMPVVMGNSRRLPHDLVLQGYRVPKGMDVILPHAIVSIQNGYFDRAEEFIPERWLKETDHAKSAGCEHAKSSHPFTYMPFGFGNRACIGKRFAELEISVLVTRLVREFDLSWHYPKPKEQMHIIKQIVSDLKFKLDEV